MKTQDVNLKNLKPKLLHLFLFLGQFTILCLLPSCDKEEVKPVAPPKITPTTKESDEWVHQVPEIPILLDGISAPSTDVLKYNGKLLIYFLDEKSEKEGVVRIFTSEEKASSYRSQVESEYQNNTVDDKPARTASTEGFTAKITVYTETNYGGESRTFSLGDTDLFDLSRIGCVFDFCANFNNKVSSIKCAQMPQHWTILYNSTGYAGSKVYIRKGLNRTNLNDIGFNDKASSIGFMPWSERQ